MLPGGTTPLLSNRELYEMGYAMVVHGTTLIMRAAAALEETLAALRADRLATVDPGVTLGRFKEIMDFAEWAAIEDRFGG